MKKYKHSSNKSYENHEDTKPQPKPGLKSTLGRVATVGVVGIGSFLTVGGVYALSQAKVETAASKFDAANISKQAITISEDNKRISSLASALSTEAGAIHNLETDRGTLVTQLAQDEAGRLNSVLNNGKNTVPCSIVSGYVTINNANATGNSQPATIESPIVLATWNGEPAKTFADVAAIGVQTFSNTGGYTGIEAITLNPGTSTYEPYNKNQEQEIDSNAYLYKTERGGPGNVQSILAVGLYEQGDLIPLKGIAGVMSPGTVVSAGK